MNLQYCLNWNNTLNKKKETYIIISAVCPAGQKYDKDDSKCEDCGLGYYQEKEGQFYCDWCGLGKTTRETNTTSVSLCYGKLDIWWRLGKNTQKTHKKQIQRQSAFVTVSEISW